MLPSSSFASRRMVASLAALTLTGLAQAEPAGKFHLSEDTDDILAIHCYNCHDEEDQKGDIQLDNLAELDLDKRLGILNRMQEQVYFDHMPPKKKERPSEEERKAILGFLKRELAKHEASTLEGKLQKPEYGNYVDHEKLFSGEYADVPAYTTDRRWLISEYIYNAKFQRILWGKTHLGHRGKKYEVVGSKRFQQLGISNPFLLPKTIGVRYYANVDLTGGHLSSMLTNSQAVAEHMTEYLVPRHAKSREPYMPAMVEIMALEEAHLATLASREEFLTHHIERICGDIYGDKNEALLPKFVPVVLQPLPKLKEGEKLKRAKMNVIGKMIERLGVARLVYNTLADSELSKMSDDEFRGYCERIWFNRGDHERTIQARMALLREYMPEFREAAAEQTKRRHRPIEYEPLVEEEMAAIHTAIKKHRKQGDFYSDIIEKCMSDWQKGFEQERIDAGLPIDDVFRQLVHELSTLIHERPPTDQEAEDYVVLVRSYTEKLGRRKAVQKLIQTYLLSTEFAYRNEIGAGEADEHGRRMMSPRDASYAIAYALTDQSPDAELVKAVEEGRLNTREDYEREVKRLLAKRDVYTLIDPILEDKNWNENSTAMPIRELRFFREFFGYPKALEIFKDEKRFGSDRLAQSTNRLVSEADRLVEYILENDQKVFEELIGTEKFYIYHDGNEVRLRERSELMKRIYAYFKDKDWENFTYKDLEKHKEFLTDNPTRSFNPENLKAGNRQGDGLKLFKKSMASITDRLDNGQEHAAPFDMYRGYGSGFMWGGNVVRFWGIPKGNWHWSPVQPMKIENRKGMLTHPAWLVAHAFNTETDPVHRGKFVREKLLADTIPDVPITVDAQIPEDHNKTLRQRLTMATETKSCWHCHVKMNPLGNAFEMYDDFGRIRTEESLEYEEHLIEQKPDKLKDRNHMIDIRNVYKTLPVVATGHLEGTGNPSLDGELKDAIDLADRLSKSRRVRQSFIRHAFRFFLGRNEFLSDSKTLIDAEKAYDESGGSFDAVILSLLTSDSFIYRKPIQE